MKKRALKYVETEGTDKERLLAFLDGAGVEYEEDNDAIQLLDRGLDRGKVDFKVDFLNCFAYFIFNKEGNLEEIQLGYGGDDCGI